MKYIINIPTGEIVGEIITNRSLTVTEAIELVGEIINNEDDKRFSFDGDNVLIDGKRYWREELDYIAGCKCAHCGEEFPVSQMEETGSGMLCENCYSNEAISCNKCERTFLLADLVQADTPGTGVWNILQGCYKREWEWICPECLQNREKDLEIEGSQTPSTRNLEIIRARLIHDMEEQRIRRIALDEWMRKKLITHDLFKTLDSACVDEWAQLNKMACAITHHIDALEDTTIKDAVAEHFDLGVSKEDVALAAAAEERYREEADSNGN